MSEEYLWDGSGEPDELVAELEETLSELRFEPVFMVDTVAIVATEAPRSSPRRSFALGAVTAISVVAASLLLLLWGYKIGTDPISAPTVEVVAHSSVPKSDALAEPTAVAAPGEDPSTVPVVVAEPPPDDPAVREVPREIPAAASPKSSKKGAGKAHNGRKPSASTPNVDCILDPSKCTRKGTARDPAPRSPKPSSAKKPRTTGDRAGKLPEKLTTAEIKAGVAPVKRAARACGGRHGALPGTKVKVKLSISGATGRVTQATAQAPFRGTELGLCVAAALSKARFKKFRKASIGAVYPITL